MDLLINPRTSYVIQTDLASLHQESQAWLSELAFWEDELSFLHKLLHSKLSRQAYPTDEIAELDKSLITINSDKIEAIKTRVLHHERSLPSILEITSMKEEDKYRKIHRELHHKMIELYSIVKEFKVAVYAFIIKYQLTGKN